VTALSIIGLVVGCTALLLVVVLVSVRLMGALFKRSSGYARLVSWFPAPGAPEGRVLRGQTAQFGAVRYSRCVTLAVEDGGLFLQVVSRSLGRHRPLLVPWDEVRATYPSRIRVFRAVELVVGSPQVGSVRVMPGVYAEFRSRLTVAVPLAPMQEAGRP